MAEKTNTTDRIEKFALLYMLIAGMRGNKSDGKTASPEQMAGDIGAALGKKLGPKLAGMSVDQFLAHSACYTAMKEYEDITKDDIVKLWRVYKSLSKEKRDKFTDTLSHGEQAVVVETLDKNGKATHRQAQYKNIRGAELVWMFCQFGEDELLDVLEGSAVLDVMSENIEEAIDKAVDIAKKLWKKTGLGRVIPETVSMVDSFVGRNGLKAQLDRRYNEARSYKEKHPFLGWLKYGKFPKKEIIE